MHQKLVRSELRARVSILVESDEPRETHHFATLIGYGAEVICPRLALETIAALAAESEIDGHTDATTAQQRFRTAIEDGVLKIMSKMGIATLDSYCGAQVFDAVGISFIVPNFVKAREMAKMVRLMRVLSARAEMLVAATAGNSGT